MHFSKTDLGAFEGVRLAAARRAKPDDDSPLQDLAGLIAIFAFSVAVGAVLAGILLPGAPA